MRDARCEMRDARCEIPRPPGLIKKPRTKNEERNRPPTRREEGAMAGVPSLTVLEKQYQRWGSFVAPGFFVALPVRMPGTPIRPSETNRLAGDGESGCQAPPRDAPSGSAVGRWARRSQGGLSIPPGRCQAPSKSNRSTRSQHLRRCLAPTCCSVFPDDHCVLGSSISMQARGLRHNNREFCSAAVRLHFSLDQGNAGQRPARQRRPGWVGDPASGIWGPGPGRVGA